MTNDRLDRIEQRKRMQPGYVALEIAERDALVKVARAARAYREAQEVSDRTGEWEPAREAAVVLDEALAELEAGK